MTDPNGHDRYDEWDAAYVLGALSIAERHEYEQHLSECAHCAAAVTQLAGMPGLLGALPAADAFAMLETDATGSTPGTEYTSALDPTTDILRGLTARVRRRRRARAWTVGLVGVAASVAIAASIVLPMSLNTPAQPTVSAALHQVTPSPITASVQLTSVAWGTKIAVSCSYGSAETSPRYTAQRYGLYVTAADGTTTRVSSWQGWPGSTVHATGSLATQESDITRVELRALDSGTVLLSRNIG